MKAYFDSIEKEVPEQLQQVFLNRRDTAVITIDMHDGHLSTDPDCPCPSPRGREIIEPLNHFMNEARALGLPIIHVRSTLRKGGADEKLFPSAWRMVFPVTVGEIPNIAEHAIEGTRWNRMSIDVHDEDYMVTTKKRLSAFYPTDLELLLRNLGIRRVVLTGCMTDCCVINTAIQMANKPERISISVIKANYTCGMIERTGVFNLSLLTKEVPFAFFQHFGFQSGADVDKFADFTDCARSDNGLYYINRYTNAMFSCRVVESYDQGSHRLFIAEITESKLFSNDETVTYDYYRSHIKPAPPKLAPAEKATWVCSVCGYVYEGEMLPADFICPLCKHPASDFVKHEAKPAEKRVGFVCTVCGYVYEGADMPDDFVCPLCHHPKSDFKPLE